MIEQYIQSMTRRRLSPNTIRLRLFYIRKFIQIYNDPLTVTLDDLENYLDDYRSLSENTQQTVIASLRSFYRWLARSGHIATNPAIDLLPVKVHFHPAPIANDDDILHGLENATLEEKAMILLGAECGLRVTEIATLDRTMREGCWLHIIGKGSIWRDVHMSPELEAILDQLEARQRWTKCYFVGRSGTAMHSSTVWRHIRDRVGVNPHALRHRAGTTVYQNTGHNLRLTQVFLGHSKSATTEIYVHVGHDDLMVASDAARLAA